MKYYIEDFTEHNYRRLIKIVKNVNIITTYDEAKEFGVVLRHDVDYSLHRAVALAVIEAAENIPSYYFIHLHNDFYNAMDSDSLSCIRELVRNDRMIGLHFEPGYYNLSTDQFGKLEQCIVKEKNILEDIVGEKISYMSFHNPDVGGEWHKLPQDVIGGLINVYGPNIRSTFDYCSDSNGYWRFSRLEDVLKSSKGRKIQVLLHPGWWQKEEMYPFDRIKRCVMGRAENVLKCYEENLEAHGRLNIKGE